MSSLVANAFGKVERPINLNLRPLFGACIIAEAARGASVYCFLPIVADRLESIITGCDRESNIAINEHPGIFLTTAYLIRSKVVYEEALRHAANKTWTCEEECGRCERSLEYPFNVLDERRGVARAHIAMHSLTAHNRLLAMDIEGWEYPSLSADKKWLLSYLWRDWLQKKIFQKQEMAYGDFRVKETCLRAKSLVQIENGKLKVLSAVTSGIFEQRPAIQPSSSYHQTSLKVSATASQKPQESLSTCFLMATPLRHNGSIILLRRLRDYTYPWEEKGE